jgi:nuclear pore complex protein Nup93
VAIAKSSIILTTADPVSLSSSSPPALSLTTLIWRYVRQFVRLDAKEALQYVYTVSLGADQPSGIGKEQLGLAWDLVRRVIVLANAGPAWDELVGGFRADGMRFVPLFLLSST